MRTSQRRPGMPAAPATAVVPAAMLALAALLALAGCAEDTTGPQATGTIAVFGTLYIGERPAGVNGIHVTRVEPIDAPYDADSAAVNDALVTLLREGEVEPDTLEWMGPGVYGTWRTIEARTTYHLRVEVPGHAPITASTTTPYAFEAEGGPPHRHVAYDSLQAFYPILVRCEDPRQVFVVDAYCQEKWEDARYVNPFGNRNAPDDYDEYGGDNGEPRHIFGYFRLEQVVMSGDAYLIDFYSAMMVFYGEYDVQVLSIDDNTYNYIYRDHPEENGGIVGGIGLFGSAQRRVWTLVSEP
jgi:hypothetical protein